MLAIAPAAHSASRRPIPKQPSAPAVASASSAGTASRVRRAKSSRPAYGWPATIAAAGTEPRLRTLERPSRIAGPAAGDPADPPAARPPPAGPAAGDPKDPPVALLPPAGPTAGDPAGPPAVRPPLAGRRRPEIRSEWPSRMAS